MSPPSTTPRPGGVAPMAPRESSAGGPAGWPSTFQFASLSACQVPLRFGCPFAVRGALYAGVWPTAADGVSRKAAKTSVADLSMFLHGERMSPMPPLSEEIRVVGVTADATYFPTSRPLATSSWRILATRLAPFTRISDKGQRFHVECSSTDAELVEMYPESIEEREIQIC